MTNHIWYRFYQSDKESLANIVAQGHPEGVTDRGVVDVLQPEHGDGPAVHRDVLGGGQEVEDGEHGGQGGHVRGDDGLQDIVTKSLQYNGLLVYTFPVSSS